MRGAAADRTPAPWIPRDGLGEAEVTVTVNGQRRSVATGATVADVLRLLDLDPRTIVVEHNREIVRDRATLGQRTLRPDDVLELVHFVGGG